MTAVAAAGRVLLPGDTIASNELPPTKGNAALKLGPGLTPILNGEASSLELQSTIAGRLETDNRKGAVWIENSNGRYMPTVGDLVLATVQRSTGECFLCSLSAAAPSVQLPHLAFANVSKKTRPQLASGALVYARVAAMPRDMDVQLTCVHPTTGKADGLGELTGGMVFEVSRGFARRLMMPRSTSAAASTPKKSLKKEEHRNQHEQPENHETTGHHTASGSGIVVLEALGQQIPFEICVGRNGKVWVDAGPDQIKQTVAIGRALLETDRRRLDVTAQQKLVSQLLKEL